MNKRTFPTRLEGLLLFQENVIRNDNTQRGLATAVRKKQSKVRHTPVREWRQPSNQLRLTKGTGDTKAEQHCANTLDRPTVEREGRGTIGRKAPSKQGNQTDGERRVGSSTGSSIATQKAGGRDWAIRAPWTFPRKPG